MVKKDSTKNKKKETIFKKILISWIVCLDWFDCWLIYRTIIQFKTN